MNGAESLVRSLVAGGVEICFTNPGTSEMHVVAALDRVSGMRCVLCLFEGVATGAADGYARMADRPAATLLHLGPGLSNGMANLHNARRAHTPVVNIVGDHAIDHRRFDAPLTSDIEASAKVCSDWVLTSASAANVARDAAEAITAAMTPPGRIATLILPADVAWGEGSDFVVAAPAPPRRSVASEAVERAAEILRAGEPTLLLLGGMCLRQGPLETAGRIAAASGAALLAQTANARVERGAGRVAIERVPYPVDQALERLKGFRHVILVGAKAPVAFFAYPGKPSMLTPPGCELHVLAEPADDGDAALAALADAIGARSRVAVQPASRGALPTGALTLESIGAAIGALLPEGAIVVDESITSGRALFQYTRGAPPHDWLQITGGSIGFALPAAVGAATACPDRPVIALEGDGSAMYTLQALWTQAREGLRIINVIFANRSYRILRHELTNVGLGNPGPKALSMLDLTRPELDWVGLAGAMGVPGRRVTTIDEFNEALGRALRADGPFLIEVAL